MIRVMDLFSGIGGFSLGLKRAGGFKTVAYCEIDPYCQKVLQARMSDGSLDTAPICTDVAKLDGSLFVDRVDLICGGFPCQDISFAGRGAGLKEGTRSGLWMEFSRLIGEIRPDFALVENVGAITRRGLWRVLGDLRENGYDAEWGVIPASAVGAPHLRERLWLIAYPAEIQLQAKAVQTRQPEYAYSSTSHAWEKRAKRIFQGQVPRFPEFSWCKDVRRVEDLQGRPDLPPPLFRGTRDGIPHWVDRVGACGNGVVPAIIEWIGRRINDFHSTSPI